MASDSEQSVSSSSLNLSFQSSDYEPGGSGDERYISEEEATDEENLEYEVQQVENLQVEPYQFEPLVGTEGIAGGSVSVAATGGYRRGRRCKTRLRLRMGWS